MFISEGFGEFAASMGIKLLNSSPYYAQANGQTEPSNKGIIKLIKRKIEEQPKKWHRTLNEAVLPWETRLGSRHVTFQDQLTTEDYAALMKD